MQMPAPETQDESNKNHVNFSTECESDDIEKINTGTPHAHKSIFDASVESLENPKPQSNLAMIFLASSSLFSISSDLSDLPKDAEATSDNKESNDQIKESHANSMNDKGIDVFKDAIKHRSNVDDISNSSSKRQLEASDKLSDPKESAVS